MQDHPDKLVSVDQQDLRESVDQLGRGDSLVNQVVLVNLDHLFLVHLGRLALKEKLGLLDLKDPRAPVVNQAKLAPLDNLDHKVPKVNQAPEDLPDLLDPPENQEREDLVVKPVSLDPQALQDLVVHEDHLVAVERPVNRDLQGQEDHVENRANLGNLDLLGLLDLLDLLVIGEKEARLEIEALTVLLVRYII